MEPSPFLPHTTIAIENVKIAAKAAQPKVNIIIVAFFFIITYKDTNLNLKLKSLKEENSLLQSTRRSMGRLVQNHSTNIKGLIKWLNKISENPEIKTITPACLSKANGIEEQLTLKVSRKTNVGYKLIARKGKQVQDVYLLTKIEEMKLKELIMKTNPYISVRMKSL